MGHLSGTVATASGSKVDPVLVLATLRGRLGRMVADLGSLVREESPSEDLAATARCARTVAELGAGLLGHTPQLRSVDGHVHLLWHTPGPARVILLGHLDTVWPMGTLAERPFRVAGRATGPGCFDMKAGLVQMFHALSVLPDLAGATVLVTSDEEVGSLSSRALIEREAAGADAALVLEPSMRGALKTERKGTALYRLEATGVAAHAGLEPERGANAAIEIAHQVLAVAEIVKPGDETTVVPTVLEGGTTTNTVPDSASLAIDVRAPSAADQLRVDSELRALTPALHGTSVEVHQVQIRPPLPADASRELFEEAADLAALLGLPPLDRAAVGGGSDGNLTAGVGVRTLDGLGAVGDGAHADHEYVEIAPMAERAALLAALVMRLLDRAEGR